MRANVVDLLYFQGWLHANGYSYLESEVGSMPVGEAVMTIARRAGVRGLTSDDAIGETLPLIMDIIKLRCKPKRGANGRQP